jgi:hypothetical protein
VGEDKNTVMPNSYMQIMPLQSDATYSINPLPLTVEQFNSHGDDVALRHDGLMAIVREMDAVLSM